MITVTVDRDGLLVPRRLENLLDETPKVGKLQIYRAMQRTSARIGKYPSRPPKSKYVRTNRLRKSRTITSLPNGYQLTVNPVDPKGNPYGVYVLGDAMGKGQSARMGHWPLLRTVVDQEFAKVPSDVVAALRFSEIKR